MEIGYFSNPARTVSYQGTGFSRAGETFLNCHSERARGTLSLSKGTKRESRNPENASSAMPPQGVLLKTFSRTCLG